MCGPTLDACIKLFTPGGFDEIKLHHTQKKPIFQPFSDSQDHRGQGRIGNSMQSTYTGSNPINANMIC